jgi:hypothetical protein
MPPVARQASPVSKSVRMILERIESCCMRAGCHVWRSLDKNSFG